MMNLTTRIIMISFDDDELLSARLDELSPKYDCCVFLNGKTPNYDELKAKYPSITVLKGHANYGFAAAVNQCMRDTASNDVDLVLLLNPDCSPSVESIDCLIEEIKKQWESKVAMWSPQLIDKIGNKQRTAWRFPSRFESLRYLVSNSDQKSEDFVIGACCFIRTSAWQHVGEFDERFFMYAEETDWQRRASLLGLESKLITSVKVQHIGGGSSESTKQRREQIFSSRFRYYSKWFGSVAAVMDLYLLCLAHSVRIAIFREPQRSEHRESVGAILSILRKTKEFSELK